MTNMIFFFLVSFCRGLSTELLSGVILSGEVLFKIWRTDWRVLSRYVLRANIIYTLLIWFCPIDLLVFLSVTWTLFYFFSFYSRAHLGCLRWVLLLSSLRRLVRCEVWNEIGRQTVPIPRRLYDLMRVLPSYSTKYFELFYLLACARMPFKFSRSQIRAYKLRIF